MVMCLSPLLLACRYLEADLTASLPPMVTALAQHLAQAGALYMSVEGAHTGKHAGTQAWRAAHG